MSGSVFVLAMAALILTSLPPIRRRLFELFYRLHIILFAVAVFGSLLHESGGSSAAAAAWFVDALIRYVYLSYFKYPHEANITCLPADVIRVSFPKKDFHYSGGQYLFLMVPELSIFQWHPFSISSSPHEDEVSVHIRVLGDWTRDLYDLAARKQEFDRSTPAPIKCYISGPVGAPSVDLESERYKCVMLLSGGIGITPMQSICNQLMHEHTEEGRELKKVCFVWAVRNKDIADAVKDHLPQTSNLVAGASPPIPLEGPPFVPDLVRKSSSKVFASLSEEKTSAAVPYENEGDEVLHTEYYLTRGGDGGLSDDVFISGRPDVEKITDTMATYAKSKGETRVAVLVCGPDMLVKSARAAATKASKSSGVIFDFHSETFDF
jgi:NADPH oxidase